MRWWLDNGKDSGVWPVTLHLGTIFGAIVEGTHPSGPSYGKRVVVETARVYNGELRQPKLGERGPGSVYGEEST